MRNTNRFTMFVDFEHFLEWDENYEYRQSLCTDNFR